MDITDYSFHEKIVFNTHLFSLEFLKKLFPHLGVLTLLWKKKKHKKSPRPQMRCSKTVEIGQLVLKMKLEMWTTSLRHRLTCQHILPPKSLQHLAQFWTSRKNTRRNVPWYLTLCPVMSATDLSVFRCHNEKFWNRNREQWQNPF